MSVPAARFGAWIGYVLPVLLLGALAIQLWVHVTRTSATSDEPVHIVAGYRYWQCGDFAINPEHPPLLKLLATAPLRSWQLIEPDWPCGSRPASKVEVAYAGAQLLARNGMDRILVPARLAAALVTVGLAVLVFLAAREMFGATEALVALALFVFEPTVIAHGSLVTTDMAFTAAAFAAVYALYRYGARPSAFRLLVLALAVGVMAAVKHSALLMLPVLLVLMLADCLLLRWRTPAAATSVGAGVLRTGLAYAAVLLVAYVMLWGTYGFRYYALPDTTQESLSIAGLFAADRPGSAESLSGRVVELFHRARLFPESYTFGLADVVALGERPAFLLGKVYRTGRWFYFPIAFTIKSSLALLVLLACAVLQRALYRTHPRAMLFLLLPSLAYFGVSMTSGLNIGIRHVLPVYPLFIVLAAAGACWWSRRQRAACACLLVLLVYHAVTAVRVAPSYIGFANDLWGGSRQTYRLLNDSNADWGQNAKLVEAYVTARGIHDCWFAAAGMADLLRPYRVCRPLPSVNWSATQQFVDLVPPVIEGTVFISSWELPPWGGAEYAPLAATTPIDVLGGSIVVFRGRFDVPLVAALSYAGRADQLLAWGRFAEALEDARHAVEIGPNDPRTRWVLAVAAARNGLAAESAQAADAARRLAAVGPVYFAARVGG